MVHVNNPGNHDFGLGEADHAEIETLLEIGRRFEPILIEDRCVAGLPEIHLRGTGR
jgi:hypothetical protein